ncbi:type I-A CRISPR-associated protein Cas4/Csa1 [Caldivirga sp.]|uniref:type I-A CRISPR-associated protein Cas4/Csa1 n=1 Tax=Caldivirga sp. TaxID=2080243 RepID=UPI003D0A8D97
MFYTIEDSVRVSRSVGRRPRDFISDELRGWRWSEPPVSYVGSTQLSVSDVSGGLCPVGRDVYLRYVARVKESINPSLQKGQLIHGTYEAAIRTVKRVLYSEEASNGVELMGVMKNYGEAELRRMLKSQEWILSEDFIRRVFWDLWGKASSIYAGALDKVKSRSIYLSLESIVNAVVPLSAEVVVDGSLIGLSRSLRMDAVLDPGIPIEIKTRPPNRIYETALAGYALALESQFEAPVDFGVLVYVNVNGPSVLVHEHIIPISDQLRIEFLHERDRRGELVDKGIDPGLASKCNNWCPFLKYCGGGEEKDTAGGRVGRSSGVKKRAHSTVEKG